VWCLLARYWGKIGDWFPSLQRRLSFVWQVVKILKTLIKAFRILKARSNYCNADEILTTDDLVTADRS
jgi:hypothetical protein